MSGKQVLPQWFSYRKRNRERPIIGERRPPSELGKIQPDHWLAEYTTELLNVLNVLGWLVDLEPAQAALLKLVCSGPTISSARRSRQRFRRTFYNRICQGLNCQMPHLRSSRRAFPADASVGHTCHHAPSATQSDGRTLHETMETLEIIEAYPEDKYLPRFLLRG